MDDGPGDGHRGDEHRAEDEHQHGDDHDGDGNHDHHDHDHHHDHDLETVGVSVVTVTSSRTLEDDPAGDAIAAAFEDAGHETVQRELVPDKLDTVQSIVDRLCDRDDTDVVVTTGGTGVTPDDVTVEAVHPLFDKTLPGFGELFRAQSVEEIGTRVVGTRAIAGIADGVPVFCLPGSESAARLGSEEIIVPEAPHLAGLSRRDGEEES